MAVVTRLPYELLSRIFEIAHFEPDDPTASFDPFPSEQTENKAHVPTLLSHVSRHFRHIAITSAILWSQIHLTYALDHHGTTFSRTKLWLERSKDCPLDIDIDLPVDDRSLLKQCVAITDLITLLHPCSRWRYFRLHTPYDMWAWSVVRLCDGPAPILRAFEIWSRGYGRGQLEAKRTFNAFQDAAPRLDAVRLGSIAVLPWCTSVLSGLKHLEIREATHRETWPSLQQLTGVLAASPGLESLNLCGPDERLRGPKWSAGRITLDSLLHIELSSMDVNDMVYFLTVLDLPSLRSFATEDMNFGFRAEHHAKAEQLSRYLCSQRYPFITRLHIEDTFCSESAFEQLLTGLPTIEELEMISDASLFDTLINSDAEADRVGLRTPFLLPKLRSLKMCGYTHRAESTFKFVFRRRSLGGALTDVCLAAEDVRSLPDTDIKYLQEHFNLSFFRASDRRSW